MVIVVEMDLVFFIMFGVFKYVWYFLWIDFLCSKGEKLD